MIDYIVVEGTVKGKSRPRLSTNTGRIYTPKPTKNYEELIAWCYRTQGGRNFLDQPVKVEIIIERQIPKGASKADRAEMMAGIQLQLYKPDCDNVGKVVLDALNGVAYNDDQQVVELNIVKRWAKQGRLLFNVERIKV